MRFVLNNKRNYIRNCCLFMLKSVIVFYVLFFLFQIQLRSRFQGSRNFCWVFPSFRFIRLERGQSRVLTKWGGRRSQIEQVSIGQKTTRSARWLPLCFPIRVSLLWRACSACLFPSGEVVMLGSDLWCRGGHCVQFSNEEGSSRTLWFRLRKKKTKLKRIYM